MATHSSILLAWRIPWTERPGRLQSKESDMTEAPEAHTYKILGREETNSTKFSKEIICIICHLSLPLPVRVSNKNIKTSTILSFSLFLLHSHMYTCKCICVYIYVYISYNYIMLYNYIMELGFRFFFLSIFQCSIFLTSFYLPWKSSIKIKENLV